MNSSKYQNTNTKTNHMSPKNQHNPFEQPDLQDFVERIVDPEEKIAPAATSDLHLAAKQSGDLLFAKSKVCDGREISAHKPCPSINVNPLDGVTQPTQAALFTESTIENWITRINQAARGVCGAIINAGKVLIVIKAEAGHGNFSELFKSGRLEIDERSAQMMMRVAENQALANPNNYSFLPDTLNALHTLATVDASQLQGAIERGEVDSEMTIKDARALVSKLAPIKQGPEPSSTQPNRRLKPIAEHDPYARIIAIIEEEMKNRPGTVMRQLVSRLMEYLQNISREENDFPRDEFD